MLQYPFPHTGLTEAQNTAEGMQKDPEHGRAHVRVCLHTAGHGARKLTAAVLPCTDEAGQWGAMDGEGLKRPHL